MECSAIDSEGERRTLPIPVMAGEHFADVLAFEIPSGFCERLSGRR
jgi:hypothetical protein